MINMEEIIDIWYNEEQDLIVTVPRSVSWAYVQEWTTEIGGMLAIYGYPNVYIGVV